MCGLGCSDKKRPHLEIIRLHGPKTLLHQGEIFIALVNDFFGGRLDRQIGFDRVTLGRLSRVYGPANLSQSPENSTLNREKEPTVAFRVRLEAAVPSAKQSFGALAVRRSIDSVSLSVEKSLGRPVHIDACARTDSCHLIIFFFETD